MSYWITTGVGLLAQLFFSVRMMHQWLRTERAQRIVSPAVFWIFSICGSYLLLLYGWLRSDLAIIFGQCISYYIYIWNLDANGIWKKLALPLRLFLLLFPPAAAGCLAAGGADAGRLFHNPDIPLPLLLFGFAGQALFTLRFVYQWAYSSRRHVSVLPMGFWCISLAGALLITLYGCLRLDVVLILGQATGVAAYSRNIVIGLRSTRKSNATPSN